MKNIEKIAKDIVAESAEKEGDWSNKVVYDEKGILGLDSKTHTTDGYKLVRVPETIFQALLAVGLTKRNTFKHIWLDGSTWTFSMTSRNLNLVYADFKKWIVNGFDGIRVEGSEIMLYFNS